MSTGFATSNSISPDDVLQTYEDAWNTPGAVKQYRELWQTWLNLLADGKEPRDSWGDVSRAYLNTMLEIPLTGPAPSV